MESVVKLKNAEERLTELKSSMVALGKEATDAMLSVEDQQQRDTFQKLLTMVLLFRYFLLYILLASNIFNFPNEFNC